MQLLANIVCYYTNHMVETSQRAATGIEARPLFSGKELFPPASPRKQIEACLISVRSALRITSIKISSQKREQLEDLTNILKVAYGSSAGKINAEVAQKIVDVTGTLLGSAFIDEINGNKKGLRLFGKSYYGREKSIPIGSSPNEAIDINLGRLPFLDRQHFMTPREQERVLNSLQGNAYIKVKNIDEFREKYTRDPNAQIVFTEPISYMDIIKMLRFTRKNIPGQIVVPVRLSNRAAAVLTFRAKDAIQYNYVGVISELPRQEIWRASLEAGIPIYRDRAIAREVREQLEFADVAPLTILERLRQLMQVSTYMSLSPAEAMETRKTRIVGQLLLDADKQRQEILHERNKDFYCRNYGFEHPVFGGAEMTFTRSGVSANEAVILAIARQVGQPRGTLPAYTLPGWYYENRSSIQWLFKEISDPKDAQVLFINAEPNSPSTDLLGSDYMHARQRVVDDIVARAEKSPDKQYFVVIDKTTDLLWKPFASYGNLPANLTIIETASLTKHQRGERKHFFGAVWLYGSKEMQKLVNDSLVDARGTISVDHIVHLPRITPTEVERDLTLIKAKQAACEKGFQEAQEELPEAYRWHLEHYNYFSFLRPSYKTIFKRFAELVSEEDLSTTKVSEEERHTFIADVEEEELGELAKNYLNLYANMSRVIGDFYGDKKSLPEGISYGDSFGLNTTRLGWIGELIKNPLTGRYSRQDTLRFAWGYETSERLLYERGKKIGSSITAVMEELNKRASIDDLKDKK